VIISGFLSLRILFLGKVIVRLLHLREDFKSQEFLWQIGSFLGTRKING
jgi:hypothetical protein